MTTFAVAILATLLIFGLWAAAASLRAERGWRVALTLLALPAAALAGLAIAATVGVTPGGAYLRLAPLAAGALVALLTRSPGYGLLAGLVVAAAGVAG
jgi:hypothetical protein